MRISYATVCNWLVANGDALTVEQLTELGGLVEQTRQAATARENKYKQALEHAAASVGVTVEELLKRSRPADSGRQEISRVRKPYLNPYAPEDGLFALFDNRMPEWAATLISHPDPNLRWAKTELHYNEIEAAYERHNNGQKWGDRYGKSAQAIYAELEQKEPTRYTRSQKRK